MKSLAYATLFALALTPSYGFAQTSTGHKMSDEELIKAYLAPMHAPLLDERLQDLRNQGTVHHRQRTLL